MRSCEATGKNIEQAIENALFELKAVREDVDIKILSEGGFLKKAKVLVSISEDALDKYEKREKLKEEIADEDFAENFVKQKIQQETEKEEVKKEEKKQPEKTITIVADEEYVKPEKKENAENKISAEEFIDGILKSLNLEANVEKTEDERFCFYSLTGENLNDLIGHHGECMLALSQIMNIVCKNEDRKRFVLDVENYRKKREESLIALAKRVASKVAKTGRYYKLEPMDASERKIIHTALQDDDRVTTLSKGEEPRRYLIVFPKEYRDRD